MEKEYNRKRINPPFHQHDYHVLTRLRDKLKEFAAKYLRNNKVTILDYGCGSAPYKELFFPYAKRYLRADINRQNEVDIPLKKNSPVPLPKESIDVVLSTQVLEHVDSVDFYLSECSRLLKKGGYLFISTHGLWPYHPYPSDYHRFTKKGLIFRIEKFDFECLDTCSVLGPFASTSQFVMLLIAERLANKGLVKCLILAVLSLVGNMMIFIEDKLFPVTPASDASLFVVCAKKI